MLGIILSPSPFGRLTMLMGQVYSRFSPLMMEQHKRHISEQKAPAVRAEKNLAPFNLLEFFRSAAGGLDGTEPHVSPYAVIRS